MFLRPFFFDFSIANGEVKLWRRNFQLRGYISRLPDCHIKQRPERIKAETHEDYPGHS